METLKLLFNIGLLPNEQLFVHCVKAQYVLYEDFIQLFLNERKERGCDISSVFLQKCFNAIIQLGEPSKLPTSEVALLLTALRILERQGAPTEIWRSRVLRVAAEPAKEAFLEQLIGWVCFNKSSPFLVAVGMDDTHLMQQLILDEAPLDNIYPAGGRTSLQLAAGQGNRDVVNLLLRLGTDVNCYPSPWHGATALQAAAIEGYMEIALDLLHAGADINAPAGLFWGRTALEGAAENGRLEMVCVLVNYSPDLSKRLRDCKRAARLALSNGHSRIAKLLHEHAKKISDRLGVWHHEIDSLCFCHIQRALVVQRWLEHPKRHCTEDGNDDDLSCYAKSLGVHDKDDSERIREIAFGPNWRARMKGSARG